MYEGAQAPKKIDTEFEYDWYMESIELHCEGLEMKAKEVLHGMFVGVLRYVTGYLWIDDCPDGIDLAGVRVTAEIKQNEEGKNQHAILGNWDVIFTFVPCENPKEKATTKASLESIRNSMERFVRAKYNFKEPEDLKMILLQRDRDALVKHFVGVAQ